MVNKSSTKFPGLDDDVHNNKDIAVQFLQLVIARRIDEAYDRHIEKGGKHHNQYFAAGFPVLRKAMIENHQQFPDTQMTIEHVLEDADLVAIHSHVIRKATDPGYMTVHIFRFNHGKIVEMWDVGQEIGANSPNKDGAF